MAGQARESVANRISLYLANLEGGGAERSMLDLARGFSQRGYQVDLVLASAFGPLLERVPDTVRLVDLGAGGVIVSLPKLISYLRRERPSAAIATLPHASIVLLWARMLSGVSTRILVREATTPSGVRPSDRGGDIRHRLMPWLMRRFYPAADVVVAVSNGVSDDLQRYLGVPAAKVVTVYNPVVSANLTERAAEEVSEPWLAEGQSPVILSVGRLREEKDFPTLIRAFARVRDSRPARLIILGEGEQRRELERLISQLGLEKDVKLPGFVPNPLPYMARASVYALSSSREGLPGALIQALACGCPVVSTDCPSGPAEVLQGGRLGELVPVGDSEALAAALLRTLDAPLPGTLLRERAEDFSEEDSIQSYLELMFGGSSTASPPAAHTPV